MLQPQPSGTRFRHSSAHHPLVVDSLELHTGLWTPLRTFVEECIILHFTLHLHPELVIWTPHVCMSKDTLLEDVWAALGST